jgi:membrane-associated protease RseP (regulator of RpoE activity)
MLARHPAARRPAAARADGRAGSQPRSRACALPPRPRRARSGALRATETTDGTSSSAPRAEEERLRTTMADLDALLGVVDDDKVSNARKYANAARARARCQLLLSPVWQRRSRRRRQRQRRARSSWPPAHQAEPPPPPLLPPSPVQISQSNTPGNSSLSTAGPLSQPALERTAAESAQRIAAAAQQQQQQQQQGGASSSSSTGPSNLDGAISEQMKKILERAKALAEQQQLEQQQQQQQQRRDSQLPPSSPGGSSNNNGASPPPPASPEDARAQQEALRQEFEQLLDAVFATSAAGGAAGGGPLSEQEEAARRGTMTRAEVAALKGCGAFGPTTFWITEVRCLSPEGFVGGPADRAAGLGQGPGSPGISYAPPPQPPATAAASSSSSPSGAAAAPAPPPPPSPSDLRLSDRVGVLVRGNLRARRADVFRSVQDKVREAFGGRYEVLLVPDPDALLGDDEDGGGPSPQAVSAARARAAAARAAAAGGAAAPLGGDDEEEDDDDALARVAFHIVPAAVAQPPASSGAGAFQLLVAASLLALLVAACVQLALVANVAKLPAETLRFFSDPANLEAQQQAADSGAAIVPPGLDTWDPRPYIASALPVAAATLGVTFAHEGARRGAAFARGVRLGPTYFIPNLQIGSFGAITPIASLLPSRRELWDVAAAGPIAGGLASAALLFAGLAQSHVGEPGSLPAELLVPVPAQLLQGSLLLGSLTRAVLGDGAAAAAAAAVQAAGAGAGAATGTSVIAAAVAGQPVLLLSPLAVAGWCGCVTTALNLLPVGSLDGGRMFQAAYGRQALSLASFFTYVGLGLGLVGSSLSLPFGLYVLICRRPAERYVRDSVTPIPRGRRTATAAAVLAALLVLLPVAPEVADQVVGVGGGGGGLGGSGLDGFL